MARSTKILNNLALRMPKLPSDTILAHDVINQLACFFTLVNGDLKRLNSKHEIKIKAKINFQIRESRHAKNCVA
jgi:hypothetical protein